MPRIATNDLAHTHPDLAAQLVDGDLSHVLSAGSHRKVEWECEHGHRWFAEVKSRVRGGNGCPVCSNRLIVEGVNDVATTHPDLAREMVDQTLAHTFGAGSSKKVEWECSYGHRWWATIVSRSRLGNGCPVCANQRVVAGVNDLATTHPELAAQLVDPNLATKIVAGTDRKVRWRCEHGHEWEASVASRKGGAGCPYCAGNRAIVGETDLATTYPEIAAQAVDKDVVREVSAGSEMSVEWECEYGHRWFATPATRVAGVGCPVCANRKVVVGVNDLATTHPNVAAMLAQQECGHEVVAGSGRVLEWRCLRGHTWKAPVYRVTHGSGCPVCANQSVIVGVNNLGTTMPDLARELADSSDADILTSGSSRLTKWRCQNGHEWFTTVCNRRRGYGCPVCSGHGSSSAERKLLKAVHNLVGDDACVANDRHIVAPLELDIVIPSKRIAIEFNGLYWHSVEAGKTCTYHRDKRRACEDAGYRLFQVWEDDWRLRRDVVMRMLAAKLGAVSGERVFARKLEVRVVSFAEVAPFFEANHIQGAVAATMHVGGFADGRLVAAMSIRDSAMSSRMRYASGEWEIRRYATSCSVVGGFSKLLAFAEREIARRGLALSRWVSISDCDVSDGGMYCACGFVRDRELDPDYKYWGTVTGNVRRSKEAFQKRRFRERDDLVFEEGLTEVELARLNGLHRVYDSGKIRWIKDVMS